MKQTWMRSAKLYVHITYAYTQTHAAHDAAGGAQTHGNNHLSEEKLLLLGLITENQELRRVCYELQEKVQQSLDALQVAASDVHVSRYARVCMYVCMIVFACGWCVCECA
jgi:hypothetical protein